MWSACAFTADVGHGGPRIPHFRFASEVMNWRQTSAARVVVEVGLDVHHIRLMRLFSVCLDGLTQRGIISF